MLDSRQPAPHCMEWYSRRLGVGWFAISWGSRVSTWHRSSRVRSAFGAPLIFTLCGCLWLLGCSAEGPAQSNNLIGQWQCVDRPWTIKFTEDGQVAWKEVGPVFGGTYEVGPQGAVQLLLNNGDEIQGAIQIDGNRELVWNGSDGSTGRFKRVR